ncbi:MAG: hypothetical protein IOC69_12270, partial [Aestuariivirga sp.]|nr:hypothetical protein [Aestuariivirga sp.]
MDEACLEKLGTMLIGVSVAGVAAAGAGVPPGLLESGTAGAGLFLRLKGQRRSDADAVLHKLKQVMRKQWQAWGETATYADDNLRAFVVANFEHVIPLCAIPAAGVVGARLNADRVAQLVLAQAEIALKEVYADKNPRNVEAHHARLFLLNVTRRAYAALLAEPGYIDKIAPDLWRGVLEGIGRIEEGIARQSTELAEIREMLVRQTNADRPGFAEEHAELILALAERYLPEPTSDFMAAYKGIKAALVEYDRMRAEPALPANTGDQINALLERLDALNNVGSFDDGAKLLAMAREEARERIDRETSELLRLLDRTVLQSRLRNKPDEAAATLVEKLRLDTPPDLFDALRDLQDDWYVRGRDGGLNFEAAVAIHLARTTLSLATDPDQRGTALNNLGAALAALGRREAGTERLEQAVEAFCAALTEYRQDRVPLQWATAQMNLGVALADLGEREAGTERLEQAAAAYRAALTEYRQDRVPLDWALTQMNLGTALTTL